MNNFSRATSALVLTASLLASSVAAIGQTSTNTKSTEQAQKTNQTQKQNNRKQNQQQTLPQQQRLNLRPRLRTQANRSRPMRIPT